MDGAGGKDAIRAGAGKDKVKGGAGADMIDGGSGKDTIDGGAGKDKLTGGANADRFVFSVAPGSANADKIKDFVHGVDKIVLDDVYNPINGSSQTLKASQFYAADGASAAHDKNDRVIYDTLSGKLLFDKDGVGGEAAKLIATLTSHPVVDAADFVV
jgi:serralysin